MYFIHFYKTQSAHTKEYSWLGGLLRPWVDLVKETKEVHYSLPSKSWNTQYLTFKALEDGTFKSPSTSVQYSLDFGETWTLPKDSNHIKVERGQFIMWKGELNPSSTGIGNFSSTGRYEAMGNPYSLLYGDGFGTVTDLSGKKSALYGLFRGSTGLTSAENLSLPATTLAISAYTAMFSSCTSLTKAPALPATTLAASAYTQMFSSCTSLTTAPELPATTLANDCYEGMFQGCTSLTAAPELPATTLAQSCYNRMFDYCKSLTTAPALPATTLANYCYLYMFYGCTSLTTAPELPATTLKYKCYDSMFSSCTSLNYIKAMFTTTPSDTYTSYWVSGVASTGTFVKNSAATWTTTGLNGIPTGWTVETASA